MKTNEKMGETSRWDSGMGRTWARLASIRPMCACNQTRYSLIVTIMYAHTHCPFSGTCSYTIGCMNLLPKEFSRVYNSLPFAAHSSARSGLLKINEGQM